MPCISVLSCSRDQLPACHSISAAAGPVVLQQPSSLGQLLTWDAALGLLRDAPQLTRGTPQELAQAQQHAASCIQQARALVQADSLWNECGQVVIALDKALALVLAGRVSQGRALAVELIGFAQLQAQLAQQLKSLGVPANANPHGANAAGTDPASSNTSSSTSSTSSGGQFKVPALPLKRQRSPTAEELQQQQPAQPAPEQQHQQQQPRRHSAPKRRATPQVWSGGPICITPAAPPNSGMHGETVCDETLLPYWCPISGKRLKTDPQPGSPPAVDSPESFVGDQQPQQQPQLPSQPEGAAVRGTPRAAEQLETPVAAAAPRPSSVGTRSSSLMQQGPGAAAAAAPVPPPSRAAVSSARNDAIEALKRSMHEDPASKPAADVLLFNKTKQLPVVAWTGPIKHQANGRVVEVCSLTLQVPEAFLEEFPAALFAAEIRHRKAVSLGRHVVCRANLQLLSEHQLASLATMAQAQLVCLCRLQTAELHLVPYFDNRNHVRCVGFLKVPAA